MHYCTVDEIQSRYGEVFLARHAGDGEGGLDAGLISDCIAAASTLLDPVADAPGAALGLLQNHATTIAAHRLALQTGLGDRRVRADYDQALAWIERMKAEMAKAVEPVGEPDTEPVVERKTTTTAAAAPEPEDEPVVDPETKTATDADPESEGEDDDIPEA